jgi:hypothetical protein
MSPDPRFAPHRFGEQSNLGERREVGDEKARVAALALDPLDDCFAARPIATVNEDACALRCQPLGDVSPDAVGRAGYERRLCPSWSWVTRLLRRMRVSKGGAAQEGADLFWYRSCYAGSHGWDVGFAR